MIQLKLAKLLPFRIQVPSGLVSFSSLWELHPLQTRSVGGRRARIPNIWTLGSVCECHRAGTEGGYIGEECSEGAQRGYRVDGDYREGRIIEGIGIIEGMGISERRSQRQWGRRKEGGHRGKGITGGHKVIEGSVDHRAGVTVCKGHRTGSMKGEVTVVSGLNLTVSTDDPLGWASLTLC